MRELTISTLNEFKMKFRVTRTSLWKDTVPPCEGAYQEERLSGWNKQPYMAWFIDINSLEELIALENKVGDIIIGHQIPDDVGAGPEPYIEIYDTFRE